MSITFQGEAVSVSGSFPQAGQAAPNFTLCSAELADITLESMKGQKLVLNIFPSIDTPVCAASVREFHQKLASVEGVAVLNISADLPFATGRFCTSESIDSVQNLSFFRSPTFTEDYGVNLNEGALKGLATRAVVVVDEEGKVMHSELVSEITEEPNYQAVLEVVGA
ncbi:thiol peroxidase [Vibrio fortis]|uniref:Thiol peroxidase n=1 Tax=Vibrio fortis TaxID=212667 RepID=A0A066UMT2_9VIBR|nr:thiol peroxidase [Vibrio fortis]KDN28390.1 thiol peroxidase [Vibrio fortis]